MNHLCHLTWNNNAGKQISPAITSIGSERLVLKPLAALLMLAFAENSWALPAGGQVTAGSANISSGASSTTIIQSTQNVAINWQSFNIGSSESVNFVQPTSSSVALNRVLGADPSSILGSLTANGKVFLVNPNGILFGKGASVNVGGLVASTLNITDADFIAGKYKFAGASTSSIDNQGSINANGGYVALLGASVSNEGKISAQLGTVALASGNAITLDVAGDGLLNVTVDQGAVNALAQNGGMIQADGGLVLLTAQTAGNLLPTVVNNTGIIQAQALVNRNGTIKLLGDMQSGTVKVEGTLDASAPNGGNGGFIETSAAQVKIASDAKITTAASNGNSGTWLIDPNDFTIAASGGDITGAALSADLGLGAVTIQTTSTTANCTGTTCGTGTLGNGDIFVNDAVSWTAATTLTLSAYRNVNISQLIDANVTATGAGSVVLRADNTGRGPGAAAGTVSFTGAGAVNLNTGAADIFYNPSTYATPTNYIPNVTGGTLRSHMLVFINNASAVAQNKIYDSNVSAAVNTPFTLLTGPDGITAGQVVSLTAGTAAFNTKDVATANTVTFSGYILVGADAGLYSIFDQPKSQTASISPKALTATVAVPNKAYDGTTTATPTLTITSGLVGAETVSATGTATFNSKDVATANLVTVNSTVLADGTGLASNYSLVAGETVAASITPKSVTIAGTAASNKVYDGSTLATLSNIGAVATGVGTETLTLNGPLAANINFNSKDVATANLVTATGYSIADGTGLAGNYMLTSTSSAAAASIAPASLTVTASDASKIYGQTPTLTAFTSSGLQNGETIGSVTETSAGAAASASVTGGTYAITPSAASGGTFNAGNYSISYVNGMLAVTPAPLTITASNASKIFDGLSYSGGNGVSYSGFVNGETAAVLGGSLAYGGTSQGAVNVGYYTITPSGYAASNYTLNYVGGILTINPTPETGSYQEVVAGVESVTSLIPFRGNMVHRGSDESQSIPNHASASVGLAGLNLTMIGTGVKMTEDIQVEGGDGGN